MDGWCRKENQSNYLAYGLKESGTPAQLSISEKGSVDGATRMTICSTAKEQGFAPKGV